MLIKPDQFKMNNSIRKVSKGFTKSFPTSLTLNAKPLTEKVFITSIVNLRTHPTGPRDLALFQNIHHGHTNLKKKEMLRAEFSEKWIFLARSVLCSFVF